MSTRIRLCLVALALAWIPEMAAAQDTTATPTSLARVLAEAARDFPTGAPVYLVARLRFPEYVIGGFPTRAQAVRMAQMSGPGFGAFGPYVTPLDSVAAALTMIDSILVFRRSPGGKERIFVPTPCRVDALFFTQAAWVKFLIPRYTDLYGPQIVDSISLGLGPFDMPGPSTGADAPGRSRNYRCHCGGTVWCWPPVVLLP